MTPVLRGGMLCLLLAGFVLSQVEEGTGGCAWDIETDPKQGLDQSSLGAGASYLAHLPEITDLEGCQKACCNNNDCQLALIGTPADGESECFLVSCMKDGEYVCSLEPSEQFEVYRKIGGPLRPPRIQVVGLSADSTGVCHQPAVVGSCRAAFPRFYYDITNGSCERFFYGGCGANGNNFETQEDCEKACTGVTGTVLIEDSKADAGPEPSPAEPSPAWAEDDVLLVDATPGPAEDDVSDPETEADSEADSDHDADSAPGPRSRSSSHRSRAPLGDEVTKPRPEEDSDFAEQCLSLPEAGPCRASMRHFYYDADAGACRPFTYGGCRGNKNNYQTEESCMSSCTGQRRPSSKKANDDDDKTYEGACVVASDPGPCRAAFPMFFFHHASASCRSFIWGGCRGNENRYGSEEECMARCTGEQGERGSSARDRRTPAFFLVSIMGAIAFVLLAALILSAVSNSRRARIQRSPSILSDKQELLPEELPSMEQVEEKSPGVARA